MNRIHNNRIRHMLDNKDKEIERLKREYQELYEEKKRVQGELETYREALDYSSKQAIDELKNKLRYYRKLYRYYYNRYAKVCKFLRNVKEKITTYEDA